MCEKQEWNKVSEKYISENEYMMSESSNFVQPSIHKFYRDYDNKSLLKEDLLRSKENWSTVQDGFIERTNEETLFVVQKKNINESRLKDQMAKNMFSSIDKTALKTITQKETSKQH